MRQGFPCPLPSSFLSLSLPVAVNVDELVAKDV